MPSSSENAAEKPRPDFAAFAIATAAGLALALTALFFFAIPVAGNLAGSRDFVSYWATGQQLLRHANPYDGSAILSIEHSAGFPYQIVLLMRNPPWALPLAYPLGFLGIHLAAALWSLPLLACLFLSVHLLHPLYPSADNLTSALALSFTPALICFTMGQTALFALLGLALFLRLHKTRPFAAGASLWLCALKPHLLLPFVAALIVWIVAARAFRLLAGAVTALALSSAAAFLIAPHAWRDYFALMRSPAVENDFIPCLAALMRNRLAPHALWLQYLPAALACFWALVYFWRRRASWDWTSHGSLLALVSLLVAPYCWFYDLCLAIPALMHGACATRFRALVAAPALMILLMDAEVYTVRGVASYLYLWIAPALLVWYLAASATARRADAVNA